MASKRTKFTVGLFIFCGVVVAILALVFLGVTRFYEKGTLYVTYFDESVQGLSEDSPVKYRGVPIGRVEDIRVAPDSKLIEVLLKIDPGYKLDESIVAQLQPIGITGSVFVGLDTKKEGEPDRTPEITFRTEYPVIDSRPSDLATLVRGIDDILERIKDMDIERIPEKIELALDNLNHTIVALDIDSLSRNLKATVQNIRYISDQGKWEKILADVEKGVESIQVVSKDLKTAVKRANRFMGKSNKLVSRTDERLDRLYNHLLITGQNLERASEELVHVVNRLYTRPSLLLFDKPPPPRKVAPEEPSP